MIENYLSVMEESLQKKDAILDCIMDACKKQENLLKEDKLSLEDFDHLMDKKDEFAKDLEKLDDGFESLYEKVGEQLKNDKEKYRTQIVHMQTLIQEITEKSTRIQTMEERNKQSMEMHLSKERNTLQKNRQASTAAYNYYKSMSSGEVPSSVDMKN